MSELPPEQQEKEEQAVAQVLELTADHLGVLQILSDGFWIVEDVPVLLEPEDDAGDDQIRRDEDDVGESDAGRRARQVQVVVVEIYLDGLGLQADVENDGSNDERDETEHVRHDDVHCKGWTVNSTRGGLQKGYEIVIYGFELYEDAVYLESLVVLRPRSDAP